MPVISNTAQPGWISVQDAVKMVEAHTRQNPTVDLARMMRGLPYLRKGFVFNIFLMKRVDGRETPQGVLPCMVATDFDMITLKETLKETFRAAAGTDFEEDKTKKLETISEPTKVLGHGNAGTVRRRVKTTKEKGDMIDSSGSEVQSIGNPAPVPEGGYGA